MKIRAIRNHIVFTFVDEVTSNGLFREITESGIDLCVISNSNANQTVGKPRWGIVAFVGPEVQWELRKPGTKILIEPLKWSNRFEFDGITLWRTDSDKVMAYKVE